MKIKGNNNNKTHHIYWCDKIKSYLPFSLDKIEDLNRIKQKRTANLDYWNCESSLALPKSLFPSHTVQHID